MKIRSGTLGRNLESRTSEEESIGTALLPALISLLPYTALEWHCPSVGWELHINHQSREHLSSLPTGQARGVTLSVGSLPYQITSDVGKNTNKKLNMTDFLEQNKIQECLYSRFVSICGCILLATVKQNIYSFSNKHVQNGTTLLV